jgi:integrase
MIRYIELGVRTGLSLRTDEDKPSYTLSGAGVEVPTNILFDDNTGKLIVPASLWLIDLVADPSHEHENNLSAAKALRCYFQFMQDNDMEWDAFPKVKLQRPTYAFKQYIMRQVKSGDLAYSTGNLYLGAVKRFYLWLFDNKLLDRESINAPFTLQNRSMVSHGKTGGRRFDVTTSDMRLPQKLKGVSKQAGKAKGLRDLCPLSTQAVDALKQGLFTVNKEHFTLCTFLSVLSGLREEEALTMPRCEFVGDIAKQRLLNKHTVTLSIAPHNGVETKNNKRRDIDIPYALYERLCTYAAQESTSRRAGKSSDENPRLFISNRGTPFKSDELTKRMSEMRKVLQAQHGITLDHKYHDLRATYATEYGTRLLNSGMPFSDVFAEVKARLGHEQDKDTLKYMQIIQNRETRKQGAAAFEAFTQEVLGE